MTLLTAFPTVDASTPVPTDTSHGAADRNVDPHNQTSTLLGKFCLPCGGLLVLSHTSSLERNVAGTTMTLWPCVNWGNCVDRDILANRGNDSRSARVQARLPVGPQRTERRAESEQA